MFVVLIVESVGVLLRCGGYGGWLWCGGVLVGVAR